MQLSRQSSQHNILILPMQFFVVDQPLMIATLEKAKKIGLTRIELTVRENNTAAINLYTKFDFKKVDTLQSCVLS